MRSSIKSAHEFCRRLSAARADLDALLATVPKEQPLDSIARQLEALDRWTDGDQTPTQAQKDQLNFGLLASRSLHDLDPRLASELYALASFVIYW